MQRRTNKKYSLEFKLEAVRLSNESGMPLTQVARDAIQIAFPGVPYER
jgi:transposase-like protein